MTVFCSLEAQSILPALLSNKVVFLLNLRRWQHPLSSRWSYFLLSVLPFILLSEFFFIIMCPFSKMTSGQNHVLWDFSSERCLKLNVLLQAFTNLCLFKIIYVLSVYILLPSYVFVHLLPSFNKDGKHILSLINQGHLLYLKIKLKNTVIWYSTNLICRICFEGN